LAVDGVEDKRIGTCITQADQLRAHVLVADVEGLLADERGPLRLGGRLDIGHGALTPAGSLEHEANLLGLGPLQRVVNQEGGDPAILRRDAEHPLVLAALPLDDPGAGRDYAHPRLADFAQHGADRERVRRAIAADHDDAVVALADTAGIIDRARGFALIVISDHAQLFAEHAARLLDLIDSGIDAPFYWEPRVGRCARQFPSPPA